MNKSVVTTPLSDIDSLVYVSIIPVSLTLLDAKNIKNTSARFEAKVLSKGEGTLGRIGFCWSTSQNPTILANILNCKRDDSINFSSNIYNLSKYTKYYARAFAYNELGISYSNQIEFSVRDTILPVILSLSDAKNITNTSASFEAKVLSKGEGTLGEIGFCWSTTQNPWILGNNVIGTWKDSINFLNTISSLNTNTKYYARAYAFNEFGIYYSNQIEFSTLNKKDSLLEVVTIGTQIWTSKNLDVSTYGNGDTIRHASTPEEWQNVNSLREGAWCYYNYDPKNGEIYGKLYNWYCVNDPRGLAPKGYHIPSDAEWSILSEYLGGLGFKMQSTSEWANGANGDNSSGFNALPGGYCNSLGEFYGITNYASWWSSSEDNTNDAWHRSLGINTKVYRIFNNKNFGFSVRCLRD